MRPFDLTDLPPNANDGLIGDIARSALDLAEQYGAPAEHVKKLRQLLHRAEAAPVQAATLPRRAVLQG